MADENSTIETDDEVPSKGGGGLMGKLAIAGFIGGVILVECLLANMFIPTAEEIAAAAEERRLKLENQPSDPDGAGNSNFSEVELGTFGVTSKQAGQNVSIRVDFKLFGTVPADKETEFKTLLERNMNRFRSRVLVVFRNASRDELQEAQLGLIKRQILEKSHALFGKPLLRSVGFSEFSTIEQ